MTMMIKPLNVLGLMGGTSLDGIKAALVSTDGVDIYEVKISRKFIYPEALIQKIRAVLGLHYAIAEEREKIEAAETDVTNFLTEIVKEIKNEIPDTIDVIGLEGPTICHEPENGYTYQLGKGRLLAENTGIFFVSRGIRGNLAQVQIVMGVWRLKYGDAVLGIQDLFYRVESLGCKAFLYAYAGEREKASTGKSAVKI